MRLLSVSIRMHAISKVVSKAKALSAHVHKTEIPRRDSVSVRQKTNTPECSLNKTSTLLDSTVNMKSSVNSTFSCRLTMGNKSKRIAEKFLSATRLTLICCRGELCSLFSVGFVISFIRRRWVSIHLGNFDYIALKFREALRSLSAQRAP